VLAISSVAIERFFHALFSATRVLGSGLRSAPIYAQGVLSAEVGRPVSVSRETEHGAALRPFKFRASDGALGELRRRIAATKWRSQELVTDASQGVQLATMRDLARHWQTIHHWRTVEARMNSFPQFTTTIDGVDIHFIHVRSQHPDALPVIVTHGWPVVNAASLPPDVEMSAGWDACMASVSRPATQARIKAFMEMGFHKPGDVENRLGHYLEQLNC
jgi:hypothetical protein